MGSTAMTAEGLRSKFETFALEQMKWAQLAVSVQEVAADNRALVRDLSTFDQTETVSLLAGLLTVPYYQSHCLRFELLVTLAAIHCRGRRRAGIEDACRWFRQMGASRCAIGEDPAEDVFVSLVHDERSDYRVLEGAWEGVGFHTQVTLDVVATMPNDGAWGQVKRSVRSLLVLSDLLCGVAGLDRYQVGPGEKHAELSESCLPDRHELVSRTRVRFSDLGDRGVHPADLEPFLFSEQMMNQLVRQEARYNFLDRHPLTALTDTDVTVAKPSALTVAIRDYALSQALADEHGVEVFDRKLATAYSMRLSRALTQGAGMAVRVDWAVQGANRLSGFGVKIDDGYYLVCQFFLPTVRTHRDGGFGGLYSVDEAARRSLRRSFERVAKALEGRPGFKGGLHLLVGCGWGRACAMDDLGCESSRWRFQHVSAPDFVRLWDLEGVDPKYIWSLLDSVDVAEKAGVRVANPNGLLNLIGWCRYNDGHVVPQFESDIRESVSPDAPLFVQIPTDLAREVRAEAVRRPDRHHAVDYRGERHRVRRSYPDGVFQSESANRVYGSVSALERGQLVCVYEGGGENLWVVLDSPTLSESATALPLFKMVGVWLHRIGAAFKQSGVAARDGRSLTAHVEFRDQVDSLDNIPADELAQKPTAADLATLCRVAEVPGENACKAIFDTGFLGGFRIAENVAERLVVRTLVRAYLRARGVRGVEEDAEVAALEASIVRNNEARDFHVFQADDYHSYARASLPPDLVEHQPVDQGAARVGLAWCGVPVPGSRRVEGRSDCTAVLAKVVDSLASDLTARLARYGRRAALRRLVMNCEKADAEERRWTMTSAAVLGLHGHDPRTIERIVERKSRFAGTRAASRILVEVALCACPPDAGTSLADIEMRQLLARADLIAQLGGVSDAIYYNVIRPEVIVSPLGDVLFHDDFGNLVARPTLDRMIREGIVSAVPLQRRHYDDPRTVSREAAPVEPEFLRIWKVEMGFDLVQATGIIGVLEQYGLEHGRAALLVLGRQRYFELTRAGGVSRRAAASFLSQFSLHSRPRWQEAPDGFSLKDIYPWRFGRRLSYITRPILALDGGDDGDLMVAPAALRQALIYVFLGAHAGRFDRSFFRTSGMKDTWLGVAREGHSFNATAAQNLSDAGWTVRENLGLSELLNRRWERNWGDVDVLAWRGDRATVLVIECKDLAPARNYSEIAALLSEYQGVERNGKADKLKRHLDRVSLLRENRRRVGEFTGVADPRLVSCMVCSGPVPMQYASIEALSETYVGVVEDVLSQVE